MDCIDKYETLFVEVSKRADLLFVVAGLVLITDIRETTKKYEIFCTGRVLIDASLWQVQCKLTHSRRKYTWMIVLNVTNE